MLNKLAQTSDLLLFENAFRFAPIGMAVVSTEGRWLKVNHSLCNLLGYSEDDFLLLDFQSITHEEDLDADLELLRELASGTRESYQMEKRYIHKDGSIIWALLSVSSIRNIDGSARFYISQIQDLSELKQTRETLMNHSRMMALGEMSAGIAHEINNPLTVINLHATAIEMMATTDDSIDRDMMVKFTSKINETVKRIGSIVMSLKRFARQTSGHDCFEPAKLGHILSDALELCREKFRVHDVELKIDIEEDIEIECNPVEISQVLINLINNSYYAVKELPEKWVTIKIQSEGTHARMVFMDSGPGIPAHIAKKIMEPFFTTKPVGEGSGLGLSISKSIVQFHQGEIFLDDKSERTCFVIRLPVRQKKKRKLSIAS